MLHVTQSESPTIRMSGIRVVPRYSSSLFGTRFFIVYGNIHLRLFTVTKPILKMLTVNNWVFC